MRFDRLSNFRDIGGVETKDGRRVRTGMVFRSDELTHITRRDVAKLDELGIKLICDLRAPAEIKEPRRAHSIDVVNVPLNDHEDGSRKKLLGFLFGKTGDDQFRAFTRRCYHLVAFENATRVGNVIRLLAKDGHLPAIIHCAAGKDRTGFVAAVLLLLLGVSYEHVLADYLRTNDQYEARLAKLIRVMRVATLFQITEKRMRLVLMAHPEFLDDVHDKIVEIYGSVDAYISNACEIDHATVQKLKDHLLT